MTAALRGAHDRPQERAATFAEQMTWERCARMFLDNLAILRRDAETGRETEAASRHPSGICVVVRPRSLAQLSLSPA